MATTKQLKVDLLMNVKASQEAMSFIRESKDNSHSNLFSSQYYKRSANGSFPEGAYPAQRYAYGVESQVFKARALDQINSLRDESSERLRNHRLQLSQKFSSAKRDGMGIGEFSRLTQFAQRIGYTDEQIDKGFSYSKGSGGGKYSLRGHGQDIAAAYYREEYNSESFKEAKLLKDKKSAIEKEIRVKTASNKLSDNQLKEDETKLKLDRKANERDKITEQLSAADFGRKARNFGAWNRKRQDAYLKPFVDDSGNIIQENLAGKHSQEQIQQLMGLRNPIKSSGNNLLKTVQSYGVGLAAQQIGQTIISVLETYNSGYRSSNATLNSGFGTKSGLGLQGNAVRSAAQMRYSQNIGGFQTTGAVIGGVVGTTLGAFGGVPGAIAGGAAGVSVGSGLGPTVAGLYAYLSKQPHKDPAQQQEFAERVSNQYDTSERARYGLDTAVSRHYAAGLSPYKRFSLKGFNDFSNIGYSPTETVDFANQFKGNARNLSKKDLLSLASISRGFDIGSESLSGFMSSNKFSGANSPEAIKRILGDAYSKNLSIGLSQQALDRYSGIAGIMGSSRSSMNPGDVLGMSSYFANMGGAFGLSDPRSLQRTTAAMSSMNNLQGGFGQASGFLAAVNTLQSGGKQFGLFDIGEKMQQGGPDYYKNLTRMFKRPGIDSQFAMQAFQQVTNLPYADVRRMFGGDFSTSSGAALDDQTISARAALSTPAQKRKEASLEGKDLLGPKEGLDARSQLIIEAITQVMKDQTSSTKSLDDMLRKFSEERAEAIKTQKELKSALNNFASRMPFRL